MAETTMLHVRVDQGVKVRAQEALEKMGQTISEAMRVFLMRVAADQVLPFQIEVPKGETRAATQSTDLTGPFATGQDLFNAIDA